MARLTVLKCGEVENSKFEPDPCKLISLQLPTELQLPDFCLKVIFYTHKIPPFIYVYILLYFIRQLRSNKVVMGILYGW